MIFCKDFILNTSKTNELIRDFHKPRNYKEPYKIFNQPISSMYSNSWALISAVCLSGLNTTTIIIIKKAQQSFSITWKLKSAAKRQLLIRLYSAIIQSILTSSTWWYHPLECSNHRPRGNLKKPSDPPTKHTSYFIPLHFRKGLFLSAIWKARTFLQRLLQNPGSINYNCYNVYTDCNTYHIILLNLHSYSECINM